MMKKISLVTGAAQGIGLACARALLPQCDRVIMVDIKEKEFKQAADELGKKACGRLCDMSEPDAISDLFDDIERDFGPVSILVNNAGVASPSDFLSVSVDDIRNVIELNLIGTFVATQRAAQTMVKEDIRGSVVNMSSVNAQMAIPSIPAYCASKGGVMQLTKAASLALAPHGIRVNAVDPGSIRTEMMAGVNEGSDAMKMVLSRTPQAKPSMSTVGVWG